MQNLHYRIGSWEANADILQVDDGKLMAMIKVWGNHNEEQVSSQHTVVFEHRRGMDAVEETRLIMKDLLEQRYQA